MAARPTTGLTVNSKPTQAVERRARTLAILLLSVACATTALLICDPFGRRASVPVPEILIISNSVLYGAVALYLSDVRNGNPSALQGMLVISPTFALWAGWYGAWVGGEFVPSLAVFTAIVMVLPGLVCGAVFGVWLGWLKRSALGALPKPARDGGDGLTDPWLDHPSAS